MQPPPKDESLSSLDALLSVASDQRAGKEFADYVVDSAYTEAQVDGSPRIVRFLAPALAAAAGVAITLLVTGNHEDASSIAADMVIPDTEVMITELDVLDHLLALESSSDLSLVGDDELDALLF